MTRRWHVRATAYFLGAVVLVGGVVWAVAWLMTRLLLAAWGVRP